MSGLIATLNYGTVYYNGIANLSPNFTNNLSTWGWLKYIKGVYQKGLNKI